MGNRKIQIEVSGLPLILLLGSLSSLLCSCGKGGQIDDEVSVASPCILVSQPSEHSGKQIKLVGYVTSTKEGAYIWGDDCKTSGIVLHMGSAVIQNTKFQEALLKYGLSPSPIKATLVGRFRYERLSGVKSFDADRVLEVQISDR